MNVRRFETHVRSRAMRTFASAGYLRMVRSGARLRRKLSGTPQAVHYFHQVDDPYSHLAVQKLDPLRTAYRVPFTPHLVSKPGAAFQGNSEHFEAWGLRDALSIAQAYGTSLRVTQMPEPAEVHAANDLLAPHLASPDFARLAVEVGDALWNGRLPPRGQPDQQGESAVRAGDGLRHRLGHYQGGMFYFDGEWFWGVDRIRLLERRLIEEGLGDGPVRVPEPAPDDASGLGASQVVLEYFPSLRSPYTAIGHARVLDLAARSGVTLKLRPVMPMLMRGITAPFAKQRYIITDAAREARARGVRFGRIVDPFGEPVKRAFALFPGAVALGKGLDFVTAYLSAAWAEGVDITTDAGLRQVARHAGIDWDTLQRAARDTDWEPLLAGNLDDMLADGLWGVPSFRVSGGRERRAFVCWGQDRIWRVEHDIAGRM